MDKQMIEEIAGISYGIFTADNHCPFDKNCPYLGGKVRFGCNDCLRAVAIINAGYRKIPEGAVVLTGEEHKQILKDLIESNEKAKEIARKETAEKFAEMAREGAFVDFMGEPIIRASKIDEICKELIGGKDNATSRNIKTEE